MKPAVVTCLVALLPAYSTTSVAQDAAQCPPANVMVTVSYQFADTDARAGWVYDSLQPTLAVASERRPPIASTTADGVLTMKFCLALPAGATQLTLRVGPRVHDLAARPILPTPKGRNMSPILLVGQVRPDWVIVKSRQAASVASTGTPIFEFELFNFGGVHPGGEVTFEASRSGYSCFAGTPPSSVNVEMSFVGKRLKVASSDPEYPDELIVRQAEFAQATENYCQANYRLQASLGPTGRLPAGPTRIRYAVKTADQTVMTALRNATSKRLTVTGEGIW